MVNPILFLIMRCRLYVKFSRLLAFFALVLLNITPVQAGRMPPPPAQSLEYKGIRFVAPNDNGEVAYLQIWDTSHNGLLYTVKVFQNAIYPNLERDEQHVYILNLEVVNNLLVVTDERDRKHYFDIQTDGEMQSKCIKK